MAIKKPLYFWRRASATFIDLSLIWCLTVICIKIGWLFVPIHRGAVFITLFALYYLLSYLLLNGRTPAKILCGLRLVGSAGAEPTWRQIVIREIIGKTGLGIIVPLLLIEGIFEFGRDSFIPAFELVVTGVTLMVVLMGSVTAYLVARRTWWELASDTCVQMQPVAGKRMVIRTWIASGVVMLASVWIALSPFVTGRGNIKNAYFPRYPVNAEVRKYADFIRVHRQNPVDYILGLFDRYDIVVLSERMHPEYTQYQLISEVIQDPRFAGKVGNLFTECGSVSFQDTLNTLLNTSFASRDSLDVRTALLQRNSNAIWPLWDNTNLFDLLESVNLRNAGLPDSARTKWYFTDLPVDWRHMNHQKFLAAYGNIHRDSFMAAQIIERFDHEGSLQSRHKALVIMNTRHGYGVPGKSVPGSYRREYGNSTAAYLMDRFPGKVANVMLNTVSIRYGYVFTPIQQGKWDAAFSLAGNPDAGFDFSGSPFGDDVFDAGVRYYPSVTYKDVFTGFIFYQPLEVHFDEVGFAHEFDGFEDTLLRRSSYIGQSEEEQIRNRIDRYEHDRSTLVSTEPMRYALIVNLLQSVLLPLLILISLAVSSLWVLWGHKKGKRHLS